MYFLLFCIICCSVLHTPAGGGAMVPARTRSADHHPYRSSLHPHPSKRQRRQLADTDILNILRDLISVELEDEDHERQNRLGYDAPLMGYLMRCFGVFVRYLLNTFCIQNFDVWRFYFCSIHFDLSLKWYHLCRCTCDYLSVYLRDCVALTCFFSFV